MNRNTDIFSWRLPIKTLLPLCLLSLISCVSLPSESMTPARFQEIVNTPADTVPLAEPLSRLPFWPNMVISNVMTYASGQVFQEEMPGTVRTVAGRYIVYTVESKYYQQTISSVVAYDPRTSAIKTYGLYGDGHGGNRVTAGSVTYDFARKTYTITSAYDDFTETTTGSYTASQDVSQTVVHKSGALFMTRATTTRPAPSRAGGSPTSQRLNWP